MKKLLNSPTSNWLFLLFILLFAYAQSIYTRLATWGTINEYVFTPEAAIATLFSVGILFFILYYFIKNQQKKVAVFGLKEMLKIFTVSLITFLITMKAIGFLIAFSFDNIEKNFNQKTIVLSTISNLLDGFIYGSFFLAYYYYLQNNKNQNQLIISNQAIAESKINQLKTQLNPHFLFNNLNVLDQLIEEDREKASNFLNDFADIYRYVLQATDKKFITLKEELIFAEQYFKLVQHKYGKAYQLLVDIQNNDGYIVPLTLQLLIENAVKHNLGTLEKPVFIQMKIDKNIAVTNSFIPKRHQQGLSGKGLINLKEQYNLMTSQPVIIQTTDTLFSVSIPVIYTL